MCTFWAAGGWNVINDFSSHGTLSHSQCISSEVTNPTVPGIQAIGMDTFNESMAKWYSNSFLRLPDQGPTGNCPSEWRWGMKTNTMMYYHRLIIHSHIVFHGWTENGPQTSSSTLILTLWFVVLWIIVVSNTSETEARMFTRHRHPLIMMVGYHGKTSTINPSCLRSPQAFLS